MLNTNEKSVSSKIHDLIQIDFNLPIGKRTISKILNRSHYMTILFIKHSVHQQSKRNITKLSTRTYPNEIDWEKIYLLHLKTTLDTILREF